ncbi:pilus assembly protein PilM [Candidatus Kaiserbacteria bacterium]|nr:pilus assembly protein PilM [Candidatus Kaiserbacteria bacterium]
MFLSGSLGNLLPPPMFLKMPSLGVDISDSSLKYIKLKEVKPGHKVIDIKGSIDIPNGVVRGGFVEDQKQLTEVMRKLKTQTKMSYVRVSLPEERAYVFETEIKRGTPFKEIRGLLEFRLEENVPISPKEALFDYEILPSGPDDKKIRIVVVVYARETIMRYYNACKDAKLVPLSFEVEAQAMARATVSADDVGAHMIVDFGKNRTGIAVVLNGALMFTSTVDIGGDTMSKALRAQLGNDIAESELTKIKNTQGLVKALDNDVVYEALLNTSSILKDEIASRLQYWHTRDYERKERKIKSVIICGGSSNMKGLPEYLTEALGVTVVRGNVWENVMDLDTDIPSIDRWHSYGYAAAVGLALKDYM